jgi:hypothetical protein
LPDALLFRRKRFALAGVANKPRVTLRRPVPQGYFNMIHPPADSADQSVTVSNHPCHLQPEEGCKLSVRPCHLSFFPLDSRMVFLSICLKKLDRYFFSRVGHGPAAFRCTVLDHPLN